VSTNSLSPVAAFLKKNNRPAFASGGGGTVLDTAAPLGCAAELNSMPGRRWLLLETLMMRSWGQQTPRRPGRLVSRPGAWLLAVVGFIAVLDVDPAQR
jgi:hypothetical protein